MRISAPLGNTNQITQTSGQPKIISIQKNKESSVAFKAMLLYNLHLV